MHLPYHTAIFSHLMRFLAALHLGQLKLLDLQFHSHPSCSEPSTTVWERLDTMLQTPWYRRLERVAVLEMGMYTKSHTVAWGDVYPAGWYDPVAYRRKIANLLPLMHGQRCLFYWDDPYALPERVPNRIRPFLPVTIAEYIMDFIAGIAVPIISDIWSEGVPTTLAACSLTCREWRPRAQAHLFRVVSLTCARQSDYNIRSFLSLLANHPALGPFIRTCTVYDTPSPPTKSPSLHNAPFRLLGVLPQVEHFRFSIGTFYPPPGIPFDACMRQSSSSIVRLWVQNVAFYSVNDLRRMVSACRNVKDLQLMRCMWRGKSKATVAGLRMLTPVRLTEVIIDGGAEWIKDPRSASFLQWLVHSGALVSVSYLHLLPRFIAGADDMLAASQLVIHACHSTLTLLRLQLSPDIDYDCCEFPLNQNLSLWL